MIGNWLWNAWFSLAGFSYYFFLTFTDKYPQMVLLESTITAGVFYLLMFGFRAILSFFLTEEVQILPEADRQGEYGETEETLSSEELATIVQSFLHEDEHKTS